MKLLFLIVALFSCFIAHVQTSQPKFNALQCVATQEEVYATLPEVNSKLGEHYVRFRQPGQIIDLHKKDSSAIGIVLNFIKEADTNHYYYLYSELPAYTVIELFDQYINSGIPELLQDSVVPDWDRFTLHCFGMTIQSHWKSIYRMQQYPCPKVQYDTLNYIDSVASLMDTLRTNSFLQQSSSNLLDNVPEGLSYTRDGYMFILTMTAEQKEGWVNGTAYRNYMDSITPELNAYINQHLALNNKPYKNDCMFTSYYAKFKKNGKFSKIWTDKNDRYKIWEDGIFWIEERRELRRCKHYLKKRIKGVNLSSFNLQYSIVKNFHFIEERIWLYD